ncbi:GGDEF domain-containing protein [Chitinasiproducens palmae]|uniref:diguanylate cyclase n=1 Tax=Chitinasiproducens palmae TaxID=1770053 RepID=A0A1H2PSE2_9BURK|nr:GGDEF domain-containing protein [Chitinasiproducens palmae]SDV49901.1 diguanylate cyclase (GGDEF) domain-containing protein [Chitinasiproducens palmae]
MPTDPTLDADALPDSPAVHSLHVDGPAEGPSDSLPDAHAVLPLDGREAQLQARLASARAEHAGHPLLAELEWLAAQHLGLVRRIDKIARISDRLQAEVLGTNKLLHARASLDALTGLGNRSALMLQLQQCRDRLRGPGGRGRHYGLLMIDLDRFKTINDRLGHAAGDQALLLVAGTLRAHTRASDVCVRWGGDEFVVLIGDCNAVGVEAVAAKLVRGFSELRLTIGDETYPLAASIGCHLGSLAETTEQSLERADAALYRAKYAGRGCYVFFHDSRSPAEDAGQAPPIPTIDAVLSAPVAVLPRKRTRRPAPLVADSAAPQASVAATPDSRRARGRRTPRS